MRHVSDSCGSSLWPLDQTIIRSMVAMEWSLCFFTCLPISRNHHPLHQVFRDAHATDIWRGGKRQHVKDGTETCQQGCRGTSGAATPQRCHFGPIFVVQAFRTAWATPAKFGAIWSMFASVFGLFSPPSWALIFLVSQPSPLGLMTGDVTPCLIAHFGRVVLVIQACALQNM